MSSFSSMGGGVDFNGPPPAGTLGYYEASPGATKQLLYPGYLTEGFGTSDQLARYYSQGLFQPTPGYNPANYPLDPNSAVARGQASAAAAQQAQATALKPYSDLYSAAQDAVANYGTTEQTQLAQNYAQQYASAGQGLQSRGLGNTTIGASVNTGIGQAQNIAQQNLTEQIGQYKTDVVNNVGQSGAAAGLGVYQQQVGNAAAAAQQQAQINANASLQSQSIQAQAQQQAAALAAQAAQSQNQFNYATALASQQYGYNSNLQSQQLGLQNQYQRQLMQLQEQQFQTNAQGGVVAGGPHGPFG